MAVTVSICLQKGGVGKSTTAQALASTLGFKGKKVLLVDMDSQANVTYASGVNEPEKNVYDVLIDECSVTDAIVKCERYDILPSSSYMTNWELIESVPEALKIVLQEIQNKYDFVIIDTPPALGNSLVNALVASDYIIIPTEPRPYAIQGLGSLYDTINSVQNSLNPRLKVLGILLIKFNHRTVLNRQIEEILEDFTSHMGTKVFSTTIREGVAVAEAQMMQKPLIDYAKNSKPNIDYKAFTNEFLKMVEGVTDYE